MERGRSRLGQGTLEPSGFLPPPCGEGWGGGSSTRYRNPAPPHPNPPPQEGGNLKTHLMHVQEEAGPYGQRDPDRSPDQALRRAQSRGQPGPARAAGLGLRPARPQRRGQIHDARRCLPAWSDPITAGSNCSARTWKA